MFFPEGVKWSHVGHSVVLRTPSSSFVEINKRKPFQARAYKFDMYHPGNFVIRGFTVHILSIAASGAINYLDSAFILVSPFLLST